MTPPVIRTILHVDMDAFYASVEQQRHPELRGQPVIVGAPGARGVVAAASYEARVFGIHSAMSSAQAQRRCPHAVFVPGDHDHYAEISRHLMAIFQSFTPLVEPISLDEAFLDVSGSLRLHGDGPTIGAAIRAAVFAQEGLTCSVGVAPSKFIAKLASEAAKPTIGRRGPEPGLGVKVVEQSAVLSFLLPLPVQALWGVGPKTLEKLQRMGVVTVADLATLDRRAATTALGVAAGTHLLRLATGHDEREVVPVGRAKSVGHEETFARDHYELASLQRELVRLGDAVAARLRHAGMAGRTVTLKVRFHDFSTITRAVTLPSAVDTGPDVVRAAGGLLAQIDPAPGVRLLGVHVSHLLDDRARQLTLDDVEAPSWDDATGAIDAIRARYGAAAIGPASLVDASGIRVKRRGDQQWGPTDQPGT